MLRHIIRQAVLRDCQAEFLELRLDDRRERVLDAAEEDLGARRHDADLEVLAIRQQAQERLRARRAAHLFHLLARDEERRHAHARELHALLDRHVLRKRRNRDVLELVDGIEAVLVDLEDAVAGRDELDLALFGLRRRHVVVLAELAQHVSRLILMHLLRVLFPDVDVVLAERQQHGDVLFLYHMALAEPRVLCHTAHDLRDVLAEHLPDCIDCSHFLHRAQHSYLDAHCANHQKLIKKAILPQLQEDGLRPLDFAPFQSRKAPAFPPGPWLIRIALCLSQP